MDLTDYLPNVFGTPPTGVEGLLGADQAQALSSRANTQGLLGAALTLWAGMSKNGAPRSAAENILNAWNAGHASANQPYKEAIDMATLQQAQQAKQAQILKDNYTAQRESQTIDIANRKEMAVRAAIEKAQRGEQLTDADYAALDPTQFVQGKMKPQSRMLTPEDIKNFGLNPNAGTWVIKDGVPSIVNGTESPAEVREYQYAQGQGFKGNFVDYQLSKRKAGATVVNTKDPTAVAKIVMDTDKQFTAAVEKDLEMSQRYEAILTAFNNPSTDGVSDGGMIYGIAKMYDPSGAVQEGDKGTVIGSRSVPESIKILLNKLERTGSLTPDERMNIVSMAYELAMKRRKQVDPIVTRYRSYVRDFGSGNPDEFIQNPYENMGKPTSRVVTINGKRATVKLANDGKYYYQGADNKFYPVAD